MNTAIIAAAHPDDTSANNAAKAAVAYSQGGKNDWFLPSKEELNHIYIQRSYFGITAEFWSSSQYGIGHAWDQNFANGSQFNGSKRHNFRNVRAVRAF